MVVDRDRISGGGVTAGLDFGLVLLAKLLGDDIAKMTQLAMEYDPGAKYSRRRLTVEAAPTVFYKRRGDQILEVVDLLVRLAKRPDCPLH